MSIDQRQFEQLSEMGIKLWQRRDLSAQTNSNPLNQSNTPNSTQSNTKKIYQKINLATLADNQCFNDILQAFNLTLGEISQQADHLDLGLLNWYFIENEASNDIQITCLNNKLVTPAIHVIANSVKLKKQLWQIISQQQT